jgi:tRNA(adenine34) deaminase
MKQLDYINLTKIAFTEAQIAMSEGEVPVGALLSTDNGEVISKEHNRTIQLNNPLAHAEILAMYSAMEKLKGNISDLVLVSTLEPCPMCTGASALLNIRKVVFDAWDEKLGACGSRWDLAREISPKTEIYGKSLSGETGKILQEYFKLVRKSDKKYKK